MILRRLASSMLAPGAHILVLATQVPFSRGGAELLTEKLVTQLRRRGYFAELVQLPFAAEPKSRLLAEVRQWRLLGVEQYAGRRIDAVICTKFPSYAVKHPNKRIWMIHQHRQLYELYGSRYGDFSTSDSDQALREILLRTDRKILCEASKIACISKNVATRLAQYSGVQSTVLEPPLPLEDRYRSSDNTEPYILSVGRLCSIKRVDLLLKALPMIDSDLGLRIVGTADEPQIEAYLQSEIRKHSITHRVRMLGRVSDEELLSLYASALAVYYAPFDEDYGFVTLESLESGVPVLSATDSGSVLDYVVNDKNGLLVEPTPEAIAQGFNRIYREKDFYSQLRNFIRSQPLCTPDWGNVIDSLLG